MIQVHVTTCNKKMYFIYKHVIYFLLTSVIWDVFNLQSTEFLDNGVMPSENSVQSLFICCIMVHIFITFLLFCNFLHFFSSHAIMMLLTVVPPVVIIMPFFIKFGCKLHKILKSSDWINIGYTVWNVPEATERSPWMLGFPLTT